MAANNIEVVTRLDMCAEIISKLMNESAIAVDAEGVNLGKTGPLTLLQVGTRDGHVYLFDIHVNKALLGAGYLKDLLETKNVVKIFHSCRGDSAALTAQFGVTLDNVFDTQIAHLEIEESKGKLFPPELKLADLCETYVGDSTALASKDDVKKAWMLTAAYWAIRPLTPEMIQYAAADVSVLFVLYDKLSRLVRESDDLYKKLLSSVDEAIIRETDPSATERRSDRLKKSVETVLKQIAEKCQRGECRNLEDLDENEVHAMELCRTDQIIQWSAGFKKLRKKCFEKFVEDTERKIAEDPLTYDVTKGVFGKLKANEDLYEGTELGDKIKRLLTRIGDVQLEQIKQRYAADTPLEYIRQSDVRVIMRTQIDKERNDVLRALFTRFCMRDLQELKTKYRKNPRGVEIHKSLYHKIRFLATKSSKCSPELKRLSKELWASFVQRYGREHNY
ncbi:uncharacterized protein LOC135464127 [Liolophura sinensis]|uniref:uncharacterized protein LOC135464127 n=1 Tax=Liolophura sinensis TaxID=3198878 RepID=UPI003157F843